MFNRIDRYLLRAIAVPLVATLAIAVMLLVLDQMLRLFDFLLDQNGPVRLVWEMLANLVPEYLALALPIGFFLGVLLAFRRLSLSSELDAILASGMSLPRLARPVYAVAGGLMILNLLVLGFVQPYSAYRYSRLIYEVRSGALSAQVRSGEFIDIGEGATVRIGGLADGARRLEDIFIERCDAEGECLVATAPEGSFLRTRDGEKLVLRLLDGREVDFGPSGPRSRVLSVASQDIPIELPDIGPFRERGERKQEATLIELFEEMFERPSERSEFYEVYRANLHWRTLHTLLFLILPMLAIPLGLVDKRRDFGAGVVVGLAMVILYYELIEAGENAVAAGAASPWLVMWPAYLALAAVSARWFRNAAHTPGARALSGLEAALDAIGGAVRAGARRLGARRA